MNKIWKDNLIKTVKEKKESKRDSSDIVILFSLSHLGYKILSFL
jgi:hypothetical protein